MLSSKLIGLKSVISPHRIDRRPKQPQTAEEQVPKATKIVTKFDFKKNGQLMSPGKSESEDSLESTLEMIEPMTPKKGYQTPG
jgi:hypothetical protein